MDGLRLITVLVFSMLGGGMAVCMLIALIVILVSGTCTRLFKHTDHG